MNEKERQFKFFFGTTPKKIKEQMESEKEKRDLKVNPKSFPSKGFVLPEGMVPTEDKEKGLENFLPFDEDDYSDD